MTDDERKLARKFMEELLEAKDPEIYRDLAHAAHVIAMGMMIAWLEERRITHCVECPGTDRLLVSNGRYYCRAHFPKPTLEVIGGGLAS